MTDPEMADRTYIEPVTPEMAELIIERDQIDAILPTIGGQTGLNTALALADRGSLDRNNVRLIGANVNAIRKAEDRSLFKKAMKNIGQKTLPSGYANSHKEAKEIVSETGFPAIIRPSYTLGGAGAGIAHTPEDFNSLIEWGLKISPTGEILIEKSVLGWKAVAPVSTEEDPTGRTPRNLLEEAISSVATTAAVDVRKIELLKLMGIKHSLANKDSSCGAHPPLKLSC